MPWLLAPAAACPARWPASGNAPPRTGSAGLADALVAEADAEDRQLAGEALDRLDADAGLFRRTRPGRDDDALRRHLVDILDRDLVVAKHLDLGAQLAQVLVEVVGEAVDKITVEDID